MLAEKLGFAFYDQEIIGLAAGTTGMTPDFISRNEESMTNSFLYDLVNQVYRYGNSEEKAPKDKIFEAESRVIRELAEKGIWGAAANFDFTVNTDFGADYIETCVRKAL